MIMSFESIKILFEMKKTMKTLVTTCYEIFKELYIN